MKNFDTQKQALEKELKIVTDELKTVGRKNPDNPKDWEALPEKMDTVASDDSDVADSIQAYEGNTAILKELEIRYNNLKNALTRIEEGTYGICKICKKEIEEKRVEANPAAETCMEHKNA